MSSAFRPSEPDIYSRNFLPPRVVEHLEFTKDFDKNSENVEIFQNTIKSEPTSNSNRFQFKKKVQHPSQPQISRNKSPAGIKLFNSFTKTLRPTSTPRRTAGTTPRPDYQGQTEDFSVSALKLQLSPDQAGYGKGQSQKENIFHNCPWYFFIWLYNLPQTLITR